jgi:hypothetical protein
MRPFAGARKSRLGLARERRDEDVTSCFASRRSSGPGLLDVRATLHLATTQPPQRGCSTVPGSAPGESSAGRLAVVITQHVFTVRRAYRPVLAFLNMAPEGIAARRAR